MRKYGMVLLAAILCLLCLGSAAAAADGLTIYGDYGIMECQDSETEIEYTTLGGEFAGEHLLAGGQYSVSTGFEPALPEAVDLKLSNGLIWVGFDFLKEEQFCLAGVVAYVRSDIETDLGYFDLLDGTLSSWSAGIKAGVNWDRFALSCFYLYGFNNEFDGEFLCHPLATDEVDFSYLECKGTWQATETLGFYLAYRSRKWEIESYSIELEGFALGLQLKF